jgi:hypothetical protein
MILFSFLSWSFLAEHDGIAEKVEDKNFNPWRLSSSSLSRGAGRDFHSLDRFSISSTVFLLKYLSSSLHSPIDI